MLPVCMFFLSHTVVVLMYLSGESMLSTVKYQLIQRFNGEKAERDKCMKGINYRNKEGWRMNVRNK